MTAGSAQHTHLRGAGTEQWRQNFWRHMFRDRYLLFMALPAVAYFLVFHYYPMYGVMIAFQDYMPGKGIWGSPWVGLQHFQQFFNGYFFQRLLTNTLAISILSLLWGFPLPIIFALMLNEFGESRFKRSVQTASYLPHFISLVVTCGMIINFLSPTNGVVNAAIKAMGGKAVDFLGKSKYFRTVYVASGVWQEFGWNSIIYLAALTGVDQQLYEAAHIDGAGRWKQMLHVTLPSIRPTIIILLILSVGNMMSVGFEKIILLYKPGTYETADVISTYVYRMGLLSLQYSFSAAVGLFNSAVNIALLFSANALSRRVLGSSIW